MIDECPSGRIGRKPPPVSASHELAAKRSEVVEELRGAVAEPVGLDGGEGPHPAPAKSSRDSQHSRARLGINHDERKHVSVVQVAELILQLLQLSDEALPV